MTVYNCEIFIDHSINSILEQSYSDFEFIVINDCSEDKTLEKLKKFNDKRIKIFNLQERLGRTKALNYGLSKCENDIISIQDADDVSDRERLAKSILKLESNTDIGMVCTDYDLIDSNNKVIIGKKKIDETTLFSKLLYSNLIAHSSITFKRNSSKINDFTYDENYLYAQDYNLVLRYLKKSKITLIDEKLLKIRVHKENMSNSKKYEKIRLLENLKLLEFSKKNFKVNFFEKIKIEFCKLKNHYKLLWVNSGE